MVLFLIGLGLGDERDITVKGLEAVKRCDRVYLEHYTAILGVDKARLEAFYGREVLYADREMVEQRAHEIIKGADKENVALLVVGDPLGATTHIDFLQRASERGIPTQVIHNASIMNAAAACGLQLYNFGRTVTICFFTEHSRPESFYDKIKINQQVGMHTLCLLDIQVKEQTLENLKRGNRIFEPPRYMSINLAIDELLEIEEKRKEGVTTKDTLCVAVARVGHDDQRIVYGTMDQLRRLDFGPPLHSLVIPSEMHVVEREIAEFYSLDKYLRAHPEAAAGPPPPPAPPAAAAAAEAAADSASEAED